MKNQWLITKIIVLIKYLMRSYLKILSYPTRGYVTSSTKSGISGDRVCSRLAWEFPHE